VSKLLFICGFPSGGTDLTKTILNAHPDIFINGEMPLLKQIRQHGYSANTVFKNLDEIKQFQALLHQLDIWHNIQNKNHDFATYLTAVTQLSLIDLLKISFTDKPQKIWGNKTPQNTENILILNHLFPQAYFLIVTRDVRDVCLSWRNKWGKDMLWCADKWAKRMNIGWEVVQTLPANRYKFIRFEDLLANLESTCRQICDFLELPFATQMLVHDQYTAQTIDGKINYGKPVKSENSQKWKNQLTKKQIHRLEEITFDTMKLLGYSPSCAVATRPLTIWEKRHAQLSDLAAMILVGNRASHNNHLAQRLRRFILEIKKQLSEAT
jgi:hypothetical protein